jgi:CRISPR-associated exonuclease Cas4
MMSFGLLLLFAGAFLLLLVRQGFRQSGLPRGVPVYIDRGKLRSGESLFDPEWNLAGRPDYILRHRGSLIPVELKTGTTPQQPFESHVLQLAAYLRLIEVQSGRRPAHGFILYPQASFRVANSSRLERRMQRTLSRMRKATVGLPDRSHTNPEQCLACGYRSHCDQALAA